MLQSDWRSYIILSAITVHLKVFLIWHWLKLITWYKLEIALFGDYRPKGNIKSSYLLGKVGDETYFLLQFLIRTNLKRIHPPMSIGR